MPNPVLTNLLAERDDTVSMMDAVLAEIEGRDMSEAERALLERHRDRIQTIDQQLEPLEAFERVRNQHAETLAALPAPERVPAVPRRIDGDGRGFEYPSAGAYLADLCRAAGCLPGGQFGNPDPLAQQRVSQARVVANQVTGDTPGILPQPIVGQVVNLIDTDRPLIVSLGGAMALGNIPGTTFTRPKISQHVLVGRQTAEKTELASRGMKIDPVPFVKQTYGGTVDISRQDIDWTSPAAWDILVRDLANVYAVTTETVIAGAFATAAGGTAVVVAGNTLADWALALYQAAAQSYRAGLRMPDRVWCSLDVWAALGSLVDVGRLVMPPAQTEQPAGSATLASFRGDVIGLPRIVVPTFPDKTCIVGPSNLYEVYEEVIGLLSVVEPSILGVTVAYGGYVAYGTLGGTAFVPLTAPADMPLIAAAPEEPPAVKSGK